MRIYFVSFVEFEYLRDHCPRRLVQICCKSRGKVEGEQLRGFRGCFRLLVAIDNSHLPYVGYLKLFSLSESKW